MDRAWKLKLGDGKSKRIWEEPAGFTAEEKRFFEELLKKKSNADPADIKKFISEVNKYCLSHSYLFHIEWPDFACIKEHTEHALKNIKDAIRNIELIYFEQLKGTKQLLEIDGETKMVSFADDIDILNSFNLQNIAAYAGLYSVKKVLEQQLSGIKPRNPGSPPRGYLFTKAEFVEEIKVLFEKYNIGRPTIYPKGAFTLVIKKVFELLDLPFKDPSNSANPLKPQKAGSVLKSISSGN